MAKARWKIVVAAATIVSAASVSAATPAVVAGAATAPATAATTAPATTTPVTTAPATTNATDLALNKIVCKSLGPPPGTRLGDRHICQTEREWEDQRRSHQQDVLHEQHRSDQFGMH